MSHKHDKRATIKLAPGTVADLHFVFETLNIPMSFTAFVHWVIDGYGLPGLKETQIFKDKTLIKR